LTAGGFEARIQSVKTLTINASFEPLIRIGQQDAEFVIVRVEEKEKVASIAAINALREHLKSDKRLANLPLILFHRDLSTGEVALDGRTPLESEIIAANLQFRNWLAFSWPEYQLTLPE